MFQITCLNETVEDGAHQSGVHNHVPVQHVF